MEHILNKLIKNTCTSSKIISNNNFIINYSIKLGRPLFASYDVYQNQVSNLKFGRKRFVRDYRLDTENIYQLDPSASVFTGSMSRGHLCPSFIMSFDKSKQGPWASTYLMSNIVPQNKQFNCGKWMDLEVETFHFIKKVNTHVKVIVGAANIDHVNQKIIWIDKFNGFKYQIPNMMYQIVITNYETRCSMGFNNQLTQVYSIKYDDLINLIKS